MLLWQLLLLLPVYIFLQELKGNKVANYLMEKKHFLTSDFNFYPISCCILVSASNGLTPECLIGDKLLPELLLFIGDILTEPMTWIQDGFHGEKCVINFAFD